ncbi:MAG: type II toxin-antitoxin system prevent-host-death family antitoxin [bacterium]|nr:type II toxin-antitoxin system prevent-host-death family antitoxin [bacterium]
MDKIIGLRELRENTESYIKAVEKKGDSFIVVRRSKPIFKIAPLNEEDEKWETIIDFTKIKKGGVDVKDVLSRL